MGVELRVALVAGALFLLFYVFKKVRSTPVQVTDTIFWFLSAVVLVLLAIFPDIAFVCADLLGIQSPANFIFTVLVAALIIRVFLSSMEIAVLKNRVNELSQEVALKERALQTDKVEVRGDIDD